MPTLHKSSDDLHYYVRTAICNKPMTLQLTEEGVERLQERGIRDGDHFDAILLDPLRERGWAFTYGGGLGEELAGQDADGSDDDWRERPARGLARRWLAFSEEEEFEEHPEEPRNPRTNGTGMAPPRNRSRVIVSIRMEAYDHTILDQSAREIIETARRSGAAVFGPIVLPSRVERYKVLRPDHRSQIEIRTHKRLIQIDRPAGETIEALNRLSLPSGVQIRIEASKWGRPKQEAH